MSRTHLQFQNKEHYQNFKRRESLSKNWIKKILIFSSFTVCFSFFTLKTLSYIKLDKQYLYSQFGKSFPKPEKLEKPHILPLLVNLKGEKGPQLVRMQIHITLIKDSSEKKILPHDEEFQKHLLFILSGQEVKALQEKRNHFERQIRSQLNAFLSKDIVDGVHIQTSKLN